jgi:hypothetical protein
MAVLVAPAFRLCQGNEHGWYNSTPMGNSIIIKGAREHNLKNIDVEIRLDQSIGTMSLNRASLKSRSQLQIG